MVITNIKTPGVYVDEIPLFPPSVAQVETAIPAFIGYTEKAEDTEGNALTLPVKIKSLLEYNTYFGAGYTPAEYTVDVTVAKSTISGVAPDHRYHLYNCIRQFYDNGGGDCYIVSVGDYNDPVDATDISDGMDLLKKYDEPTLIVFPDGVSLLDAAPIPQPDYVALAGLQQKALSLCAAMQDRFALLDLMEGNLPDSPSVHPIQNFRNNVGINFLNYGAAYYPWVITSYSVPVSMRQLSFIDDSDDSDITDLTPFNNGAAQTQLLAKYNLRRSITDTFTDTLYTIQGDKDKFYQQHSAFMDQELAALEAILAGTPDAPFLAVRTAATAWIDKLITYLKAFPTVLASAGMAAPEAQAAINAYKQNLAFVKVIHLLIALEKTTEVGKITTTPRALSTIYGPLIPAWAEGKSYTSIKLSDDFPDYDVSGYTEDKAGALQLIADIKSKILPAVFAVYEDIFFAESASENDLFANHSFFKGVSDKIIEMMATMPPSGAVAGIYAMVDRTRGVWKAPANVSLSSVVGPAVKIDNRDQEDMNVSDTGKSVNAIRVFTGKGTLVWGARTLAGNDNEWRYVPVRRFFIMVEESVKKATEPFVFEPNDANTWLKVRVMIENFLTLQWRAGALQGAKPEQAFFVNVGLGTTMNETDLLEGRMIVEIGMAAVRPAEFIILRFSHKMMEQ